MPQKVARHSGRDEENPSNDCSVEQSVSHQTFTSSPSVRPLPLVRRVVSTHWAQPVAAQRYGRSSSSFWVRYQARAPVIVKSDFTSIFKSEDSRQTSGRSSVLHLERRHGCGHAGPVGLTVPASITACRKRQPSYQLPVPRLDMI
jgi:hypothetical protein